MVFTEEEIDNIRAENFANDVWYDVDTLAPLTEDQIIEFFESGGTTLPEGVVMPKKPKGKKKKDKKDKADADAVPELPRMKERGAKRLVCLHAAGACGEIMRRQLKPYDLDKHFASVEFIDGDMPVRRRGMKRTYAPLADCRARQEAERAQCVCRLRLLRLTLVASMRRPRPQFFKLCSQQTNGAMRVACGALLNDY